ncbi:malto-oligosyltrehalose trehalohydrolase [Terrihabitans sp. B22-R8]|uniref:malto-oligosyltrehalose trehalohydrolase n=1 Tax=Terrihabitans sp. B22-R8 TaxID=3425128 RepID=UPI00403C76CE
MQRIHDMPFGASVTPEGVRFSLWAPTARSVTLVVDGQEHRMTNEMAGWCTLTVPGAKAGSRYHYRIDGALDVPDPASRYQPDDVHKDSLVVDPAAYSWKDTAWKGRPWEEAVIYELHVGTATPEGTYRALETKLGEIAAFGFTAIELMPIGDFLGSRNWGYDGVLPYAPDTAYGTPDDLKHFIEAAHAHGLMVFLDVVYNHFGPAGNYLHSYAGTFFTDRHQTPWGAGINVDGRGAAPVRSFFIHNALYWLQEYHFDGLRFDAVHAIVDDSGRHFLEELAARARSENPGRHIHLVLENEANQARWLARDNHAQPTLHTAQWADDIHNSWHPLLTGEDEGYYEDFADKALENLGRSLAEGFVYQGDMSKHLGRPRGEPSAHLPPTAFVAFLQNHDQIGNRALGERLPHIIPPERWQLAKAAFLLSPQIPLLFMGEDWDASTPFQFFVDFAEDPDLSKAVREGRRREFAHFKAFAGHEDAVPDPTDAATVERSRLNWDEARRPPHHGPRAETRELLMIRQDEIAPLLRTHFQGGRYSLPRPDVLEVDWTFAGGKLRLLLNVGAEPWTAEHRAPERALWRSAAASSSAGRLTLPPWTGAMLTTRTSESLA